MKKLFCLLLLLLATDGWTGSEAKNFVKLDATGKPLPFEATEWAMVRDNSTGLIWEVKTTDGSIHDMDERYGWNEATEKFIIALNQEKFGGFSDWRMPIQDEIYTIREKKNMPHANTDFFPHTAPSKY